MRFSVLPPVGAGAADVERRRGAAHATASSRRGCTITSALLESICPGIETSPCSKPLTGACYCTGDSRTTGRVLRLMKGNCVHPNWRRRYRSPRSNRRIRVAP